MAYVVMAYVVMAYIAMAYIVMETTTIVSDFHSYESCSAAVWVYR